MRRRWLFHADPPVLLFQVSPAIVGASYGYSFMSVTPDGNRFLLPVPVLESTREEFTVVLNWPAALKK